MATLPIYPEGFFISSFFETKGKDGQMPWAVTVFTIIEAHEASAGAFPFWIWRATSCEFERH